MRGRWRVVAGIAGPLVLLTALYLGLAWFAGQHLPSGASVAGVDVGGFTPTEAAEVLERRRVPLEAGTVRLGLADGARDVRVADLGLSIDVAATLADETSFSLDPRDLWWRLSGGGPLPIRARLDEARAASTLTGVAASTDRPVVEAQIAFTGGVVDARRSQVGYRLDTPATIAALREAWPQSSQIEAVVERTAPTVAPQDLDRLVETVAEPAVRAPLTLVAGRTPATLKPAVFAPSLAMVPSANTLVLQVDPGRMRDIVTAALPASDTAPVDAAVVLRDGRPQIVPAVTGREVDAATTAKNVAAALATPARRAAVALTARAPAVTTEKATSWGIRAPIGRASVATSLGPPASDGSDAANVAAGADRLDGAIVAAGARFSLAALLGDLAGYRLAPEIASRGWVLTQGGGLSQLASAVSEAAYRAGLRIESRTPHQVALPGFAPGWDATYPGADLTFTGDATTAVLVQAAVNGDRLTVTLWGTPGPSVELTTGERTAVVAPTPRVDAAPDCVAQPLSAEGFDVLATRTIIPASGAPQAESKTVHYDPLDPIECAASPDGDAAPTPDPSRSPG